MSKIDKKILGKRICESTGSNSLEEAKIYLAKRTEEIRQAKIYGVRPKRTFRQTAIKYVEENQHKASIRTEVIHLKALDKYIGHLPIEEVHMNSLKNYIFHRTRKNNNSKELKKRTINYGL